MLLPAVSTSTSDLFVMPSAPWNRAFSLPGFGLALGITIRPLLVRKDSAVFHSSKFHLDEVDESYPEHLRAVLSILLRFASPSVAWALHALIPGPCTRSESRCVAQVHARPRHIEIKSS
jgi:hypothetical protein